MHFYPFSIPSWSRLGSLGRWSHGTAWTGYQSIPEPGIHLNVILATTNFNSRGFFYAYQLSSVAPADDDEFKKSVLNWNSLKKNSII